MSAKVLIACEESQRVCTAFRERGLEAYSCDIQEPSGGHPEWHILGDVLDCINGAGKTTDDFVPLFETMDGTLHELPERWDLIIAHPPCTYLSNAGACRLYPRKGELNEERWRKGLEAKEFFLKMLNADCERVCVENPVSSKIFDMPPHSQEIQPWQFGHPVTKKTRLWLRGLPPLEPADIVTPEKPYVPSGTGRRNREKYGAAKRGNDAAERSKTFTGIAAAMAEQWGNLLK